MTSPAFAGKVALVTGASRGIGRAIALRLASVGARIVVNYNKQASAADAVADEIKAAGSEVTVVQADVARPEDVDRLVQSGLAAFGRIDVLVNNAGITRDTLIMRMSEDDWDSVLDTNLKSAFLVTKAVMRPMLRQRAGRIVNITSISGVIGNSGQANYSASKHHLQRGGRRCHRHRNLARRPRIRHLGDAPDDPPGPQRHARRRRRRRSLPRQRSRRLHHGPGAERGRWVGNGMRIQESGFWIR
jgi:NAD(P)-dependent dehydrogenase (short-subunit alcohol dehydrogenase family)